MDDVIQQEPAVPENASEDCLFCKIVKGEIPCAKLYEDDTVLAFLDIAPCNKGHALVLAKRHYETLFDTSDFVLSRIAPVIKKVATAVYKVTGSEGLNVVQNNYKVGGQLVPHIHFHIIPRNQEDGFKHWPQGSYPDGEIEVWRKKIEEALE